MKSNGAKSIQTTAQRSRLIKLMESLGIEDEALLMVLTTGTRDEQLLTLFRKIQKRDQLAVINKLSLLLRSEDSH